MTEPAPPLGGADIELGNFIEGRPGRRNTCMPAACAILAEVCGFGSRDDDDVASRDVAPIRIEDGYSTDPRHAYGYAGDTGYKMDGARIRDPRDWSRKFLASNGGCIYIDLGHTEMALPEVICASDFVAYLHGMLRSVRDAQVAADAKLPPGERLRVIVNSSDGRDHSYGAHLNFLLSRETFESLTTHKVHMLLFLASYQASSIVFTGQGKVGSENGRPEVAYQISQRADFFETMVGHQTTVRRPLVNLRDEPLCGVSRRGDERWARFHCIFYDATLCHGSAYMKFGVMQIILAMIAAEAVDPRLILEDPLTAVIAWSHDVTLTRRMATLDGRELTAVEHQMLILECAQRFVDSGSCNVPEAERIVALWADTLEKLAARDLEALRSRLDWVLKLWSMHEAMDEHSDLGWDAPEIKYLDLAYGSLDPEQGLYWSYERSGLLERVVDDAAIERAAAEPPSGTRARTRAAILRLAEPGSIDAVSWDLIRFGDRRAGGSATRTVDLSDPFGHDLDDVTGTTSLDEALAVLGVP